MSCSDDRPYLRPYLDAVDAHGAGFRATLWGSEEAQHLRFDVMLEMVPLDGTSIVDVGCGDGALAAHLTRRGIAFRAYTGLDAVEAMIERAQQDAPPHCRFVVADVVRDPGALAVPGADWMLFSGSLNTLDQSAAWTLIDHALAHAARGVIFNFLSDRCHPRWKEQVLAPARRFGTLAMIDQALSRSSRVRFRQDYMEGHDATIMIMHDER